MVPAIPDLQQAWVVTRPGVPSKVLKFKSDWPVPKKLGNKQVLVRIQAAALNPVGFKIMKWAPRHIFQRIPRVPEHDFAGEIIDSNGTDFSVGEQVYGFLPAQIPAMDQGALGQYVKINADYLLKRPSNLTSVEASGLSLAGLTAYQTLTEFIQLEEGQIILINGGSTAVGSFAIQLAKAMGAKVIATASAKNEEYVRKLGADEFIDYTKVDLPKYLAENPPTPKFHAIFEAVGLIDPGLYTWSNAYLAPKGIFASVGPQPTRGWLADSWGLIKTLGAMLSPNFISGIKGKYKIVLVTCTKERMDAFGIYVADGKDIYVYFIQKVCLFLM
ncbi:hypothetical protein BDQ17DRAFT_1348085 [Cyathus striatus]|nr:hypothetical protein BDQ17DRAFT_1348085 [Cyathus striatus]